MSDELSSENAFKVYSEGSCSCLIDFNIDGWCNKGCAKARRAFEEVNRVEAERERKERREAAAVEMLCKYYHVAPIKCTCVCNRGFEFETFGALVRHVFAILRNLGTVSTKVTQGGAADNSVHGNPIGNDDEKSLWRVMDNHFKAEAARYRNHLMCLLKEAEQATANMASWLLSNYSAIPCSERKSSGLTRVRRKLFFSSSPSPPFSSFCLLGVRCWLQLPSTTSEKKLGWPLPRT